MSFFDSDSIFFSLMQKLFWLMVLNVIFIVMCVPVVTIGASCTALGCATIRMHQGQDRSLLKVYWRAFVLNFRQATLAWLPMMFIIGMSVYDFFLSAQLGGAHLALRYLLLAILLIVLLLLSYIFPLLGRFENTLRQTVKNAVLMSLRHLPWTLMIMVVELFPAVMYVFGQPRTAAGVLVLMLICGFSGISYLCSWFFEYKIFPCYIPERSDKEK